MKRTQGEIKRMNQAILRSFGLLTLVGAFLFGYGAIMTSVSAGIVLFSMVALVAFFTFIGCFLTAEWL